MSDQVTNYKKGTQIGPYTIVNLLSQGSFGQLYTARVHGRDDAAVYAMKVTLLEEKMKLVHEYNLCRTWYKSNTGNEPAILPYAHWYGETDDEAFLVMDLLAMNLVTWMEKSYPVSERALLDVGSKMVQAIESFHQMGWTHGDIKPDNMMIVSPESAQLALIDFGLSKPFLRSRVQHISDTPLPGLRGTLRYASINTHERHEISRRDDLESLIYVLLFLKYGQLPWQVKCQEISDRTEREKLVHRMKLATPNLFRAPTDNILVQAWRYIRTLKFEETPNYAALIQLFRQ